MLTKTISKFNHTATPFKLKQTLKITVVLMQNELRISLAWVALVWETAGTANEYLVPTSRWVCIQFAGSRLLKGA